MSDARDDFEGQDSGPVMPVGYSGSEEERDGPPPTQPLTPVQHIARGRELIREVERARSRGYDDSDDIASWQADSMLAMAHFSGAVASQQAMMIEQDANPVRTTSPTDTPTLVGNLGGPLAKAAHDRAAGLAEAYLPSYLGTWISGVLSQHHTLPALTDHQDKLAADVIKMLSPLEESDFSSGSVYMVANKMKSMALANYARGFAADLPVYVVQQDHLVPVSNVDHTSSFGETFGDVETPGVVIS